VQCRIRCRRVPVHRQPERPARLVITLERTVAVPPGNRSDLVKTGPHFHAMSNVLGLSSLFTMIVRRNTRRRPQLGTSNLNQLKSAFVATMTSTAELMTASCIPSLSQPDLPRSFCNGFVRHLTKPFDNRGSRERHPADPRAAKSFSQYPVDAFQCEVAIRNSMMRTMLVHGVGLD